MRIPWKLIGVAGLAGVAATGVVVTRRRRSHEDLEPDELRARLHQRLSEAGPSPYASPPSGSPPHPPQ